MTSKNSILFICLSQNILLFHEITVNFNIEKVTCDVGNAALKLSSLLVHALNYDIFNGLFGKTCVKIIQIRQAVELFLGVPKVESTEPAFWFFKDGEVCVRLLFPCLSVNS